MDGSNIVLAGLQLLLLGGRATLLLWLLLQTGFSAIPMALKLTYDTDPDSMIITDSMFSQKALDSHNNTNNILITEAKYRYSNIRGKKINVKYWIISFMI